jgi:hypothetical protein
LALEPEQPEPEQRELVQVRGPLLVLVREPVLALEPVQRAGSARPEMNWASRA